MGNMSYCRWQNVKGDLRDAYDAIDADPEGELSPEEYEAFLRVVKLCCQIADDFGELVE